MGVCIRHHVCRGGTPGPVPTRQPTGGAAPARRDPTRAPGSAALSRRRRRQEAEPGAGKRKGKPAAARTSLRPHAAAGAVACGLPAARRRRPGAARLPQPHAGSARRRAAERGGGAVGRYRAPAPAPAWGSLPCVSRPGTNGQRGDPGARHGGRGFPRALCGEEQALRAGVGAALLATSVLGGCLLLGHLRRWDGPCVRPLPFIRHFTLGAGPMGNWCHLSGGTFVPSNQSANPGRPCGHSHQPGVGVPLQQNSLRCSSATSGAPTPRPLLAGGDTSAPACSPLPIT